jgi:hypothetical protein
LQKHVVALEGPAAIIDKKIRVVTGWKDVLGYLDVGRPAFRPLSAFLELEAGLLGEVAAVPVFPVGLLLLGPLLGRHRRRLEIRVGLGALQLLLVLHGVEYTLVGLQLQQEAVVRLDAVALVLHVPEGLGKVPVVGLHRVGDDDRGRARDSHLAVHQHLRALLLSFGYVLERVVPVLQEIRLLVVVHPHVQVIEHTREEVVDFPGHVQYVPHSETSAQPPLIHHTGFSNLSIIPLLLLLTIIPSFRWGLFIRTEILTSL